MTVKQWNVELGHLFAFGWAMLLLSFLTKEPFSFKEKSLILSFYFDLFSLVNINTNRKNIFWEG